MRNLTNQIMERFKEKEGTIFSINDFYNIGTKNSVKSALLRLEKKGSITRVLDGLYIKPKYSEIVEESSYPSPHEVAKKIADKFSWNICYDDNKSLNLTGLSTQVPNSYIYITDGPYRTYNYMGIDIIFKHTNSKYLFEFSFESTIMLVAIKTLGKGKISNLELLKLASYSKRYIKDDLIKDALGLPVWIREVLCKIEKININK